MPKIIFRPNPTPPPFVPPTPPPPPTGFEVLFNGLTEGSNVTITQSVVSQILNEFPLEYRESLGLWLSFRNSSGSESLGSCSLYEDSGNFVGQLDNDMPDTFTIVIFATGMSSEGDEYNLELPGYPVIQ